MSETKRYYLGTGTEFTKAQCKEYKTLDRALKAAAKDESLVVWDEDGNNIGSLTDNVPDGAIVEGENEQNGTAGNTEQGKNEENEAKGTNEPPTPENGKDEATGVQDGENPAADDTEQGKEDESPAAGITQEETGRFGVRVICEGSLRLRRSASWDNSNECGRASKGQCYVGKRIFMLDSAPMLETIDGLFLSAAAEHVKIDKMGS